MSLGLNPISTQTTTDLQSNPTQPTPTQLPSHVNPNPNRPTKWTSVTMGSKTPHNGINTPTQAFLVQRSSNTSATELCDGYVYSVVVWWWVYLMGNFEARKEREREKSVSQKPRVGGHDHSVVGQAHRGEHHENKVPTQSRQPRARQILTMLSTKGLTVWRAFQTKIWWSRSFHHAPKTKQGALMKSFKSLPRKLKLRGPPWREESYRLQAPSQANWEIYDR